MTIDLDPIRARHASYSSAYMESGWRDAAWPASESADDVPGLIEEVERLRAVAWQLHGAMLDQHAEVEHVLNEECACCDLAARECDPHYACDDYKQRQKAYRDALGLVIGEKP